MGSRKFLGGGKRSTTWRVVLGLLFTVSSAPAQRRPVIRVAYEGGPGCPSQDAFLRELQQRPVDAVFVPATRGASDFSAEAREVVGGARGWLHARDASGRETTREVGGSSCHEVVEALALVTVLSVAPRISSAAEPEAGPPSAAPAPAPAPPVTSAPPSPSGPDPGWIPPADRPVAAPRYAPPPTVPSASAASVPWDAGAVALWTHGLGVEGVFALAIFLGLDDLAPWLASVRLSMVGTAEGERAASWGTMRTQLIYAGVEGCPFRLPRSGAFGALACAGVDVGRLRIDGEVSEPGGTSRSASKLWVDVPLSIRVEYLPVEPVQLELRAALVLPVTRYDLELIDPATVEYSMPAVAALMGLGVGVQFP
jgi:hypothetical protein